MESAINEYENLTFFFMGMKTPKERRNELGGYAFLINVGACSATFGKDKCTHDEDAFKLIGSILRSCRLAPYARASRFPVGIGSDERSRWITLLTYPPQLGFLCHITPLISGVGVGTLPRFLSLAHIPQTSVFCVYDHLILFWILCTMKATECA